MEMDMSNGNGCVHKKSSGTLSQQVVNRDSRNRCTVPLESDLPRPSESGLWGSDPSEVEGVGHTPTVRARRESSKGEGT